MITGKSPLLQSPNGDAEIGGVRYRDFYEATGCGKVDALGGANCRHSFDPYVHGAKRMYDPDPKHPSGLPNDEVYRLTQLQREWERRIRQTKRELAGAQLIASKDATLANIAEVEKLKARLRRQQAGMRAFIAEANAKGKAPVLQRAPNREWAGDMPRIRKSEASRRTMKQFIESPGVKRTIKSRGVSKSAAQKALSAEAKSQGISKRDFSMLSRTSQQNLFKDSLKRRKPENGETRRSKMKQINDTLYSSQKNYVERHGGVVLRGGEEVERWLDLRHADALAYGSTIMLHSTPTLWMFWRRSTISSRNKKGDYSEYDEEARRLLRERDAQRYLLGVSERYNIPEEETRQTERSLDEYLRLLKEAGYYEGD